MEVGLKMSDTELSLGLGLGLGLPGGGGGGEKDEVVVKNGGGGVGTKRGFSETVDLKLNLTNSNINNNKSDKNDGAGNEQSATSTPLDLMKNNDNNKAVASVNKDISSKVADPAKPPAKAQVVGWPPVRSYRKNIMAVQKSAAAEGETDKPLSGGLVKVSMDGAPYLRKVDLKMYKSYQDLSDALGKMFSSFTLGNYGHGAQGMIDFMNESKLMDLINGSDYVPTYEDKDGDWMLVGDVPWEMFVDSCKRLRIMKGKEAAGLAPRAMEKCKNRS